MPNIFGKVVDVVMEDASAIGGLVIQGLLVVVFWRSRHPGWKALMAGFVAAHLVTYIIRSVFFRNRPKKRGHTNTIERLDASSFPSLHAARTGASMGLLMLMFDQLVPVFGGLIVLVAVSRISLKHHDIWDVLSGLFLGGLIAWGASTVFPVGRTLRSIIGG